MVRLTKRSGKKECEVGARERRVRWGGATWAPVRNAVATTTRAVQWEEVSWQRREVMARYDAGACARNDGGMVSASSARSWCYAYVHSMPSRRCSCASCISCW